MTKLERLIATAEADPGYTVDTEPAADGGVHYRVKRGKRGESVWITAYDGKLYQAFRTDVPLDMALKIGTVAMIAQILRITDF